MKTCLLLIALTYSIVSCTLNKNDSPTDKDVTKDFINVVAGRSYGPNEKYHFGADGEVISKELAYDYFKAGDTLPDGSIATGNAYLECNGVITSRIESVLNKVDQRISPYVMRLITLKTELDPLTPFVRSYGNDLPVENGKKNCAAYASHGFIVKKDSSRFWGNSIVSFTKDVIVWGGYGTVDDITMAIWTKDVAKGSRLDITNEFVSAVKGKQEQIENSDPVRISNFRVDDQDRSIQMSVNNYAGEDCISISGKIASATLDSERDISVYLTDSSSMKVKPGAICSGFSFQAPLHFKFVKYEKAIGVNIQFTEDRQGTARTYTFKILKP